MTPFHRIPRGVVFTFRMATQKNPKSIAGRTRSCATSTAAARLFSMEAR
jgi:hypothetical protein